MSRKKIFKLGVEIGYKFCTKKKEKKFGCKIVLRKCKTLQGIKAKRNIRAKAETRIAENQAISQFSTTKSQISTQLVDRS